MIASVTMMLLPVYTLVLIDLVYSFIHCWVNVIVSAAAAAERRQCAPAGHGGPIPMTGAVPAEGFLRGVACS